MLLGNVGVGRGTGGPWPPCILKILAKKVVFLVSSGKTKFHNFGPLLEKFLEKSPSAPPGKNPSDAHAWKHFQ